VLCGKRNVLSDSFRTAIVKMAGNAILLDKMDPSWMVRDTKEKLMQA